MAIITTSYGNYFYGEIINFAYDDVAHTVVSGMRTGVLIPSGLGEGVEILRQAGTGEYWSYRVSNSAPYVYVVHVVTSGTPCDLEIASVTYTLQPDNNYTIHINASGSGSLRYSYGGGTPQVQASYEFTNVPAGTYYALVSRTEDGCSDTLLFTLPLVTALVVDIQTYPVSVFGASDGRAVVNILGGSGSIEYEWTHDATEGTLNQAIPFSFQRADFTADIYAIRIKDLVTGQEDSYQFRISSPLPPQPDPETTGKVFYISPMNSLQFVIKDIEVDPNTNPPNLDNQLLCEQEFEGIESIQYFQKVNRADNPVVQFRSDFQNNLVQLRKYSDDSAVKTYGAVLKEQNVGVVTEYGITIKNYTTPGISRVKFNSGALEIPLVDGDSFEILNNTDGFNGTYIIQDVVYDELLNEYYFLINKNYGIVAASSLADGRFASNITDYNVYESVIDLDGVADGQYYVYIKPNNVTVPSTLRGVSEPFDLTEAHLNTVLVKAKNIDNAFGIAWTTGYECAVRLDAYFGNSRQPGGERSVTRSSNYKLIKVNAKKTRIVNFRNKSGRPVPPYLTEKLSTMFDCDIISINNMQVQTEEGLEVNEIEGTLWNNFTIKVEVLNWYDNYNSTDSGTLSDGSLILQNTGFIKYK